MRRLAPIIAGLIVLFTLAEEASAIPPILRRGTRRMWAGGSFGPGISMGAGAITQFKLTETFGFHFRRSADGPALAFDLSESFGHGVTLLQITPRFVWDIPIVDGLGFYISPYGGLGFSHLFGTAKYGGVSSGYSAFEICFGVKGKLILGDRGYVFMQPIGIDILIRGEGATARWDFLFGGGVTF